MLRVALLRRASFFVPGIALAVCFGMDMMTWAEPLPAIPPSPVFDVDMDGDVDQEDFGVLQNCLTGPDEAPSSDCGFLDVNGDLQIDDFDLAVFAYCMSGPGVQADPSCTTYVPPVPPAIVSADSQKFHPNYGLGRISLIPGTNTESREGGPTEIHIVFDQDIAPIGPEWWSQVISSYPLTDIASGPQSLTISYLGVPDGSCLSITLHGITAADNPLAIMPDCELRIAALCADGNNDGVVSLQFDERPPPTLPTWLRFRYDYNCSGLPDAMDSLIARDREGNTASCP